MIYASGCVHTLLGYALRSLKSCIGVLELAAILVDNSKHVHNRTSITHEHFFKMPIMRWACMVVSFKIHQFKNGEIAEFIQCIIAEIINFVVSTKMTPIGC
jgi:hypothetical protein